MENLSKIKQVILVRSDIRNIFGNKIRTGKYCAQVAHASMAFLTRKAGVINDVFSNKYIKNLDEVMQWLDEGVTKICLKVESEKELMDIFLKAQKEGLNSELIVDSGYTEFNGVATKTCCALGPNKSEDIDKITGHLGLF